MNDNNTKKKADRPVRVGVFGSLSDARRAIDGLLAAGFAKERISVICPECSDDVDPGVSEEDPAGAHTAKSALVGGALLGGLTAAAGVVTTGGIGLLVVGPLLAVGAVSGGFIGAMVTRGIEPEIADYYDQALDKGKILVAVEDESEPRLKAAEAALAAAGAEPVRLTTG